MKITIGAFDKANCSVGVTFEEGDISHRRTVNACLDVKGKYDPVATAARVDQVAAGVAVKIANGAITNPPPPPEPADVDATAPADAPAA